MPALDMPIERLREYKGTNPRPQDFDAYWDRALSELDACSLDYTLEPADFQAPGVKCSYLYFTGVGGARICCRFLRPEHPTANHPGVCMFHGYSGSAGDWYDKLAYAYAGFFVLALDARGQMGFSDDNRVVSGNTFKGQIIRGLSTFDPDQLYFRNVFLDCAQTARILMSMPEVNAGRVGAMGGSQGGGLTVACASLEPRVALCVPACPFLTDYKRVWEMDLAKGAYDELSYFLRHRDPRHERIDEIWNMLGYIDVSKLAVRIKAQTILFATMMDSTCPPSTQFAIYNAITAPKEIKIYRDFGHEGLPQQGDITLRAMLNMKAHD
ncbi:MAG: acetylxylan esterase [Eubacteriales bacterium]|jgi:cephalosporin-C deacetylase